MQEDNKNKKLTKEEEIKENSNYLRGTIKEELTKDTTCFDNTTTKILKFHGIYQQDDRDKRYKVKDYSLMIRTKLPGGQLTSKQYLGLNEISEKYSNNTLRITTRQTIQFHGVIKKQLQQTLSEINKQLIMTYGSCGDVVRNVTACPVCDIDPEYSISLNSFAREISNHFLPKTQAYYEIWINGEKVEVKDKDKEDNEPIYGKTYLPRKFKVGLTLPEDNCIDVFSDDVGIVAVVEKDSARKIKILGFNILIGGGLGFTFFKSETYPRLGTEMCFVTTDKLINVVEMIVTIHRDYGGRDNRKRARLKYLLDDRGLDWFKDELEKRLGYKLTLPRKIESYRVNDHLGWHKQNNGLWYLGLFIENGRIADTEQRKVKSGLKEILEEFAPDIRLTAHQNIVLCNIKEENKEAINKLIAKYNIYTIDSVSPLRRNSMACPALPTCGLAMAEAERFLPAVISELEKLGFKEEVLTIRMSGCPNSCSRTPMGELGIIGLSLNKYNIYVGGSFEGTRLNKLYKENVSSEALVSEIAQWFKTYRV